MIFIIKTWDKTLIIKTIKIQRKLKLYNPVILVMVFFFVNYIVPDMKADTVERIRVVHNFPGFFYMFIIILFLCILFIVVLFYLVRKKNTELKDAVARFTTSEDKTRALLTACPDIIFIFDDNYNFVEYKAEIKDELYADPSEFIGKNINEVLPPGIARLTIDKIDTLRQTGEIQIFDYELEINGEKLSFDARIVSLTDDRYLAVVRNISEKKKREEEETKSHKLESIGVFAGGIAHDFNNILSAIVGYISLVRMKIDNRSKILELLAEAEKEVMGAKRLTEQLLVFSKEGGPVKENSDIKSVITESADFVMSGSKTALNYMFSAEELKVYIDREQIGQVIQNVVLNASQAMNMAGTVDVKLYKQYLEKSNNLLLQEGNYAVIEIHDEGCGIDKKNLMKIFDPYYTTKSDSNGLGLTISRNIINNHGGAIDVKSEPGAGSTFTIFLPLCEDVITDSCNEPVPWHAKDLKGLSVIIMDDEPQLRYIMQEVLNDEGADTFLSSEGGEAIELFEKMAATGKPPDLIIADLTIPGGMGGMEAIRIIREQGVAFKAIVISGYSNDPVISDYQNYGFDGYLVKPFTSQELLAAVKKIC